MNIHKREINRVLVTLPQFCFDTLSLRKNGHLYADGSLKLILLYENLYYE